MNLRDQFRSLADSLINTTFRDIAKPAVHKRRGASSFDPLTGEVKSNDTTLAIRAVFQDFKAEQKRVADIHEGDLQALLAAKTLKMTPKAGDQIVQAGINYDVISVHLDAADALYTLHLRRA